MTDVLRTVEEISLDFVDTNHPQLPPPTDPARLSVRQVHTITDRFSLANSYLIVDGPRLAVVNPGTEGNVQLLLTYLQRVLQRRSSDIDLVVLTHLQRTHTPGLEALLRECQAPVAASVFVRPAGARDRPELPGRSVFNVLDEPSASRDVLPSVNVRQVDMVSIWLEDGEGLPGHPDWRVLLCPGHAPGSLCLYNPLSYELLCSDTVVTTHGSIPFLRGGNNRRRMDETLRALRRLRVHYVYPGNGKAILSLQPLKHLELEW